MEKRRGWPARTALIVPPWVTLTTPAALVVQVSWPGVAGCPPTYTLKVRFWPSSKVVLAVRPRTPTLAGPLVSWGAFVWLPWGGVLPCGAGRVLQAAKLKASVRGAAQR